MFSEYKNVYNVFDFFVQGLYYIENFFIMKYVK